jgi:hypothetical protein
MGSLSLTRSKRIDRRREFRYSKCDEYAGDLTSPVWRESSDNSRHQKDESTRTGNNDCNTNPMSSKSPRKHHLTMNTKNQQDTEPLTHSITRCPYFETLQQLTADNVDVSHDLCLKVFLGVWLRIFVGGDPPLDDVME